MPAVEVEGLTKKFDSLVAVNHLSFSVNEGEVFGLLGPNGAGKTTTIRMLACIISASEGSARVAGYDIRTNPVDVRRSVGILTENPSLYERLSAAENLEFFAQTYGIKNVEIRTDRIKKLLDVFGLWERRNERIGVFSKGMKQKLAIARAIIHDPPILLLDEPTAGLDPEAAKSVRDLIEQLSHRERHTVLLCTHRLEDAERLCSRVMIINKGAGVITGTPQELRTKIAGKAKLEIIVERVSEEMVQKVRSVAQVKGARVDETDHRARLLIDSDDAESAAPAIVRALVDSGAMILRVNVFEPSLEEAYLKLIKGSDAA